LAQESARPKRVGTLSQIGTVTKYTFLNYFRARRFYALLAIVLIIGVLITTAIDYYRPAEMLTDPLTLLGTIWGRFVGLIVVLAAAFFGGDAISGEFQGRTGYFLVPNPIRRSAIYTGKWIAAFVASTIILGIFAFFAAVNGIYYFGTSLPSEFLQSVLYAWIYLISALSLTFAFSSLFKSSSISILMSVILLLIVFNIVDTVSSLVAGIEPWFSITYGAGIVANVLTVPFPDHASTVRITQRISLTSYNATIPEGLAILALYFIVMAIVGLWLFEKKEFTS
jgi:ABC-2 type transport system permease protein